VGSFIYIGIFASQGCRFLYDFILAPHLVILVLLRLDNFTPVFIFMIAVEIQGPALTTAGSAAAAAAAAAEREVLVVGRGFLFCLLAGRHFGGVGVGGCA
jgi:hypothetical protein